MVNKCEGVAEHQSAVDTLKLRETCSKKAPVLHAFLNDLNFALPIKIQSFILKFLKKRNSRS